MGKRNNKLVHQKNNNTTPNVNKEPPLIRKTSSQRQVEFRQELYSGPLPHPETLARYDQIVPGCAERIITVFEKQVDHRHAMENQFIEQRTGEARMGTICITLVALSLIGGGIFLAYSDKEVTGMITSFSGLLPIAFGYIRGKMIHNENLSKKK